MTFGYVFATTVWHMRSQRFVICADSHGDMVDPVAEKAFFSFVSDYKPQIRIHAGDLWDFRNLRIGASDDEKAQSLADDWDKGAEFFHRFFSGGTIKHFLLGNHDTRLWRLRNSAKGILRDYAEDGVKRVDQMLKRRNVAMLPYDSRLGILRLGHLKIIHGYAAGVGSASKHARVYGNVWYGHTHTQDVAPVENDDGPSMARGIGCLCKIDMDYNAHQMNKLRHTNGWAYGELFEDGTYQALQTTRIGDGFTCATGTKLYGK